MKRGFGLPGVRLPFYDESEVSNAGITSSALWQWHDALIDPVHPNLDGADLDAYFEYAAQQIENGESIEIVRGAAALSTLPVDSYERLLLAAQVRASRRLADSEVSFDDYQSLEQFVLSWEVPHAEYVLRLNGVRHKWQIPATREIGRGWFYTQVLVNLRDDVRAGRLFIPLRELNSVSLSRDVLVDGPNDEQERVAIRKILWRVAVRARDAFASGASLAADMDRKPGAHLRHSIFLMLEVMNMIEKRGFDVWSEPVQLGSYRRAQSWLLAKLGRSGFGR